MRITFILPVTGVSGGVRIIRNYASGLFRRGHEVTIVVPLYSLQPTPHDRRVSLFSLSGVRLVKAVLIKWLRKNHLDGFEGRLIYPLTLGEEFIPDADVVVATSWHTAEWVATYAPPKGKKFYFIQHYETWGGPKDRVDATWRLPMTRIVLSKWLKDLGEHQFHVDIVGPLKHNPVDHTLFYPDGRRPEKIIRVGMLHHIERWKGVEDGVKAFEIARKQVPNLQLVLVSPYRRTPYVPAHAEFHFQPKQPQLRKIYSSCHIWLCPSWSEGFHLPPFEAMACGCALVSTRVGGVEDLCEHEVSALISPPKEPELLAQNLIRVAKNSALRRSLATKGYEITQSITWDDNVDALEEVFLKNIESKN